MEVQTIKVIGIATRTTNQDGQAMKDIEALWQRFWDEKIQGKIPNKVSDDIYAVYTDYESDYTAPYTVVIGLPTQSLKDIPKGFWGITIESGEYEKFTSKGKMPEAVVSTWLKIWGDDKLNTRRTYQADFTVHGAKYFNGDQSEVETFISVRD